VTLARRRAIESLMDLSDFSGGLNTTEPSHALELNECQDIVNFELDNPGVLKTRKGYKKINGFPIAEKPIRGIHQTVNHAGKRFLIAACNGRLWLCNEKEGTWSEIYRESYQQTSWGSNLLTNGGFDTDLTGWTVVNDGTNTTIARDTTYPYAGAGCLKIATTEPPEILSNVQFTTYTGSGNTTDWSNWAETRSGYTYALLAANTAQYLSSPVSCCIKAYGGTATRLNETVISDTFSVNKEDTFKAICNAYSNIHDKIHAQIDLLEYFGYILEDTHSVFHGTLNNNGQWFEKSLVVSGLGAITDGLALKINAHNFNYPSSTSIPNTYGIWYDNVSLKARPRFENSALSPVCNIDPTIQRRVSFYARKSSSSD
jgi:hypothetical protein